MANTGVKRVITLKERALPAGTDTGNTKNNLPADPNYILPYIDLEDCPLVYAMTCPIVLFTRNGASLSYEFNLLNEVVKNPSVSKVTVSTSTGGFSHVYNIPHAPSENYFINTFTGLVPATDYDLIIRFLDAENNVLQTCNVNVT